MVNKVEMISGGILPRSQRKEKKHILSIIRREHKTLWVAVQIIFVDLFSSPKRTIHTKVATE